MSLASGTDAGLPSFSGKLSFCKCLVDVGPRFSPKIPGNVWYSVLWIGTSAAIQTDPSANGVVGIDWFNAFLWLGTSAILASSPGAAVASESSTYYF